MDLSIGSVNVYCNGHKSPAIRKPIDISKTNISIPSDISKPIIETKRIEDEFHDLLKELITAFIQESVKNILKEISIQDIMETETKKAIKNANLGFSTNNNKAVKAKSKKKNPVPALMVEEKPIKETYEPIVDDPTVDSIIGEKPIQDIKANTLETLTADELIEVLSINECTLAALIKQKQIPHYYVGKGNLRFKTEEILDWICNLGKKTSGIAIKENSEKKSN
jgi:hypothetical protein